MIAQAILEKGLIEGAIAGLSNALDTAGAVFAERPWLVLVIAGIVALFIFTRNR